jgi:glycosyltransferase involved in cell wall biosynthesis
VRLSVLVPAFNEGATIREVIARVQATGRADEIVVVDDGSRDGTREILTELGGQGNVRVVLHERNAGKGAAIRTAIEHATGDVLLVQDADLEYDPVEYGRLLEPIEAGEADVVYGSRFLKGVPEGMLRQSVAANRFLSWLTSVLYGRRLTDMETCYKVFRRDVVSGMHLRANRFDFEPEFTAKVLKRRARVVEVPIAFNPRGYEEGKKIGAKDGVMAVWALLRYRFLD